MNEVLHANIFFFIASAATIVFCIFICLILYHVLKIVHSIRRVVERVEASSQKFADDMLELRETVAKRSGFVMQIINTIIGSAMNPPGKRRRKAATDDEAE